LPLDENRKELIRLNFATMVELIESKQLVVCMFSKNCISNRHMQAINAKLTSCEKNEQLFDILMLRSNANYKNFVECLKDTKQETLADVFDKGGGNIIPYSEPFEVI
jgi:Caspase recruitment domain